MIRLARLPAVPPQAENSPTLLEWLSKLQQGRERKSKAKERTTNFVRCMSHCEMEREIKNLIDNNLNLPDVGKSIKQPFSAFKLLV